MNREPFRRFEPAPNLDPVFGNFEDFEAAPPPAPCRTIAITPEVLAADQAARLAREDADPWKAWAIKSSLTVENLHTARPKKVAGRITGRREAILTRPKTEKPKKFCAACNAEMRRGAHDTCKGCRDRAAAARRAALKPRLPKPVPVMLLREKCATEGCENMLRNGRLQRPDKLCKKCGVHKDQPWLSNKAPCIVCGAPAKAGTKTGLCLKCCAKKRGERLKRPGTRVERQRAKVKARRPQCAEPGCTRRLRNGRMRRADGLCGKCATRSKRKLKTLKPTPPKEIDMKRAKVETICAVASCDKLTKASSGRCSKHWAPRKGTMMRNGSEWGGLPKKPASGTKAASKPSLSAVGNGMHLLPVSASALDAFWMRLDVADKVRIVSAELAR